MLLQCLRWQVPSLLAGVYLLLQLTECFVVPEMPEDVSSSVQRNSPGECRGTM